MPSVVDPQELHSPPPVFRPRRALVPALFGIVTALWLGGTEDACFDGGGAAGATLSSGASESGSQTPFNVLGGEGAAPAEGTQSGVDSGAPTTAGTPTAGNGTALPATSATADGDSAPVDTSMPVDSDPNMMVFGAARYGLVGRFARSNNGNAVRFNVPGARVGVTFVGTQLNASISDTGTDGLNVVVDNGNAYALQLNATTAAVSYPVVANLSFGTHTAWLIRRNEMLQGASNGTGGRCGAITLWDVSTDANGYFLPPPKGRARRIEAMGDSSFNGYGVEILCGNDSTQPNNSCGYVGNGYSPQTQNVDKSVPGVVASVLDADLSDVSMSGQGVIWSYYDPGNCNVAAKIVGHCLPTAWRQTLPPASSPNYAFASPMDVVLMSVGGDDITDQSTFPAGTPAFVSGVANWVLEIRGKYPAATIVLVLSAAASGNDIVVLGGALQQAVAQAQAARPGGQDPNILYFNYFTGTKYQTYRDIAERTGLNVGYGSYGHPSTAGSQWLGNRLASFVGAHMNWSNVSQ